MKKIHSTSCRITLQFYSINTTSKTFPVPPLSYPLTRFVPHFFFVVHKYFHFPHIYWNVCFFIPRHATINSSRSLYEGAIIFNENKIRKRGKNSFEKKLNAITQENKIKVISVPLVQSEFHLA